MQIVFLSNVPDGGTFRLGSHHLSRELSQLGHDVAHVSTPISLYERLIGREVRGRKKIFGSVPLDDSRKKLLGANGRRDEHGVLHGVPTPFLPSRWTPASDGVRRFLVGAGFDRPDVVMIDQLLFHRSVRSLAGKVVYRPTDSAPAGLGKRLEEAVLRRSDAVVACSTFVWDSLDGVADKNPHLVLENGVEGVFFGTSHPGAKRSGIAYVGAIDYRFDWEFVLKLAEQFPRELIRLAGPVTVRPSASMLPSNVSLTGPMPYESVPDFLRSARVGLLPFSDASSNAGRSPMKFYEYLASELYVVSRSTPALRQRDPSPGTFLYSNVDEGIFALGELLARPRPNVEGRDHARAFDWRARSTALEQFLLELTKAQTDRRLP